jgi:hypothetical protein
VNPALDLHLVILPQATGQRSVNEGEPDAAVHSSDTISRKSPRRLKWVHVLDKKTGQGFSKVFTVNSGNGQLPASFGDKLITSISISSYTVVYHSNHLLVVVALGDHTYGIHECDLQPHEIAMLGADEQAALYLHPQQGRTTS